MIECQNRLEGSPVLAVGGANVEHSYRLFGEFVPDQKYSSDPLPRLAGGSSVNHASRLLALGVDVHPVFPLAKADPMSRLIVAALDSAAATGLSRYRAKDLEIRGADLHTPLTTIIRQGDSRTSLNEFSPALMTHFRDHVERHLEFLASSRRPPRVAMIGHIHADRRKPGRGEVGFAGEISERILKSRAFAEARSFVNFGSAQYALGCRHWDGILRDHVDVFQLDIGEARYFCRDADLPDLSLDSILGWFRERCTVVISLERFGAIGQLRGSDRVVAAWPFVLDDVVDSTGAGDAMGAGIVASMLVDPFDDASDVVEVRQAKFAEALTFGRVCGAYACTTVGGASECPSLETLAAFEQRTQLARSGEEHGQYVSNHELALIDRAFDH